MTSLEHARDHDSRDEPIAAAEWYQRAIDEPDAPLDAYLDLAVLYMDCCDFGYAAAKQLPDDFRRYAYSNSLRVLDRAEARWPADPLIAFWRLYIDRCVIASEPRLSDVRPLVARGAKDGYVFIAQVDKDDAHLPEIHALLASASDAGTARKRYLKSVLESCLAMWDMDEAALFELVRRRPHRGPAAWMAALRTCLSRVRRRLRRRPRKRAR